MRWRIVGNFRQKSVKHRQRDLVAIGPFEGDAGAVAQFEVMLWVNHQISNKVDDGL